MLGIVPIGHPQVHICVAGGHVLIRAEESCTDESSRIYTKIQSCRIDIKSRKLKYVSACN